jgi:hypothetical protein
MAVMGSGDDQAAVISVKANSRRLYARRLSPLSSPKQRSKSLHDEHTGVVHKATPSA